jgi:hypothetical protein
MADQRPPPLHADERTTLLSLLQFQRESYLRKVDGLDDVAARTVLVPSGTTLLWLTHHLAFAEQIWLVHRFQGEDLRIANEVAADETLADAVSLYRGTWQRTDAIVAGADLDERCRVPDRSEVNLRWILGHLLEETARHAGHADILRELIDGATGR